MKSNVITRFALAVVVATPTVLAQGGQNACRNSSVAGTYTVSCSGWAGAPGAQVPMKQVGVATADADGNWTGSTTVNIGGQTIVSDAKVSGKTTVNPDCTGAITYNKGTPTELNISYVVNPNRDEILGLVVDKGTVVSCVLQRISK